MYDRSVLIAAVRAAEADCETPLTLLVSRRLGVARNTAWRLLNGVCAPTARTAAAIETAYGVPAADLVKPAA